MEVFIKDPAATLDYEVDWTLWLGSDSISGAGWDVPDELEAVAVSHTANKAKIWLSGGAEGTTYEVVNRITTAAGRTDERTVYVRVQDR